MQGGETVQELWKRRSCGERLQRRHVNHSPKGKLRLFSLDRLLSLHPIYCILLLYEMFRGYLACTGRLIERTAGEHFTPSHRHAELSPFSDS